MTANNEALTHAQDCPQCQTRMVFSPDGLALDCERCGYRQEVARKRSSPAELARLQMYVSNVPEESSRFRAQVRGLLVRGVAAVKAGDLDEAHYYLESVLLKQGSDREQAQAWLWLSQICDDLGERRECLEQVLAIEPSNATARRGLAVLDGRLDPKEIIDPDQIAVQSPQEPSAAQANHFYCPRCSSPLNYEAGNFSLSCDFCGYELPMDHNGQNSQTAVNEFGIGGLEQDFIASLATARGHLQPMTMRTLLCQGCGVEFALAPRTLSVTCPYCTSVYVTETAETREIIPAHALIPFSVGQEEAGQALSGWFRGGISPTSLSAVVGVYLPVWTFDFSGEVSWRGLEQQANAWVVVRGSSAIFRDDFPVPARDGLPKIFRQVLAAYDLQGLVPYDARFLADWPAERYQISLADASLIARRQILSELRRRPERITAGRSIQDLRFSSRGLMIDSYKLILLPAWIARYRTEDGGPYNLVVNGQTGQVWGERREGVVERLISWFKAG